MHEPWRAPRAVVAEGPGSPALWLLPMERRPVTTARWDPLLICVAIYLATAVGRVHELFPALGALKPTLVAAALAVVLYLLHQAGARRIERLRSATTTCALGLLVWSALSVPGALSQGMAFHIVTDNLAKAIVMCLVIAGSVRSVRDVERLILVYFSVTVVYTGVALSRFQLGADNWRLSHLYNYDANDFATLVATALPLGLYFVLGQRRLVLRLLALAGLGLLVVGEIRSGSRGGFLALLAVAAFVLLRFTTLPARSRFVGLLVIAAVLATTASDRYWTQMQTIINPQQDYNATSDAGRLKTWERGFTYLEAHPVFGVGAGNFPVAEGTISPLARRQEYGIGVPWTTAHNSFLQVGAEIGIPGLLFFVGLIVSAFVGLRRVARRSLQAGAAAQNTARLAQSLMTALVGFAVGGFFLSLAYSDVLYALAALALALQKVTRPDDPRRRLAVRPGAT
ncbi:MAG TPA: O-antigen ligase family protein [Gemmatimonadales bacterium]|nr:O-antigen ligase family protein [Gemmatimonadales bacterium]